MAIYFCTLFAASQRKWNNGLSIFIYITSIMQTIVSTCSIIPVPLEHIMLTFLSWIVLPVPPDWVKKIFAGSITSSTANCQTWLVFRLFGANRGWLRRPNIAICLLSWFQKEYIIFISFGAEIVKACNSAHHCLHERDCIFHTVRNETSIPIFITTASFGLHFKITSFYEILDYKLCQTVICLQNYFK